MQTRAGRYLYYESIILSIRKVVTESPAIKNWRKKVKRMSIENSNDLQKIYQLSIQHFKKEVFISLYTSEEFDKPFGKPDKLGAILIWKIAVTHLIENIIFRLLLREKPNYILAGEIYAKLIKLNENWGQFF